MKKIAAKISYFNVMDIGDKLTIINAESVINQKKVEEMGVQNNEQLLEVLPDVSDVRQVADESPKRNTGEEDFLKVVFEKKSNKYGYINIRLNNQEVPPIKIFAGRLKFLSPKKKTFIRQLRQATFLNIKTHPQNTKGNTLNSFIYNLKKQDLDETKLNLVFPLNNASHTIDLGYGIQVKRLSQNELRGDSELASKALMRTMQTEGDALTDYVFIYYILGDQSGQQQSRQVINAYALSYQDIFKISKIKDFQGVVNFFISHLEDLGNAPLGQIVKRYDIKIEEPEDKDYTIEDTDDLSAKDVIHLYKQKMDGVENKEEKEKIESHFNILINRLRRNEKVSERDVLHRTFDPEWENMDEEEEEEEDTFDIETHARTENLNLRNTILTQKFMDLINKFFEESNNEKMAETSQALESYQDEFLMLKRRLNKSENREEKMKIIREIDLLHEKAKKVLENAKNLLKSIN